MHVSENVVDKAQQQFACYYINIFKWTLTQSMGPSIVNDTFCYLKLSHVDHFIFWPNIMIHIYETGMIIIMHFKLNVSFDG